jgi:hypothetical protein
MAKAVTLHPPTGLVLLRKAWRRVVRQGARELSE